MTEAAMDDTALLPDEIAIKALEEAEKAEGEKPEEPETPEEDPEQPEEEASEEQPDEDSEEKPEEEKKPRRSSRRDRRLAALEQQNRDLARRLEELAKPAEPVAEEMPEPKQEDYQDWDAYLKDRDDWSRQQGRKAALAEKEAKEREAQHRAQAETLQRKARDFETSGRDKYPDFQEVVLNPETADFHPAQHIAPLVLESEKSADVAYYLGKNPEIGDRLNGMSATAAAIEIGRIEAQLSSKPRPKTSSAPAPVKPVGSGGDAPSKSPETMTPAEYAAWRRGGGGR